MNHIMDGKHLKPHENSFTAVLTKDDVCILDRGFWGVHLRELGLRKVKIPHIFFRRHQFGFEFSMSPPKKCDKHVTKFCSEKNLIQ